MEISGVDLLMAKKKENDMEMQRRVLKGILTKRYKRPFWDQFKDAVGVFFLACFVLLCIGVVVFLVATLIENPVSLAILCGTILLMWIWGNR